MIRYCTELQSVQYLDPHAVSVQEEDMLDIKFVRENPEIVKQNIRNKFQDSKLELVDKVLELDKENREIKQEVEALRAERNKISKQIGALMGQERRMKQRKLRNRLQLPVSVLRNFPRERKKLRKSF